MVLDTGLEGKILTSAGDDGIRWRAGERLADLFEEHCDELRRAGRGGDLAVDGPGGRLTFQELDAAANRVARFAVRALRIRPGMRIGLLFDDPVDGYICMLAALKAARTRTSRGSTGCSTTPAAGSTCPPRSSSNACRARAGSTSRPPPGCAGWPSAAGGTASC